MANTAFGAASFLILEAVGFTLLVRYGLKKTFWAILATSLIIFMAGLPISIYAARYGVDMDLLTRGAGFGYIGSTLTSLIYASFTFIFYALEAAVMAYALELALGIPPSWGYLICALLVIPLVTHGVSAVSRLSLRLHLLQRTDDTFDAGESGGDWLIVIRETSEDAVVEAMSLSFKLTAREAEVLYWVIKGKINRDIADILGASPATVKKHPKRVYAKLGVETRTAAAGVATNRLRQIHPQFEG